MTIIHHALVLNLHQPHGNFEDLLVKSPHEAREILYAYDRIPRFLWAYEDIAKVHLSLSGSLLETLSDPEFQQTVYGIADCGSLLWHLQNQKIIEILGTAYYHPILPLIPEEDREHHLKGWQDLSRHLFWREAFQGFWPPEMGFSMELIPMLKQHGYRYVMVDSEHVRPVTPMTESERLYRPHIARHEGEEIIVVVRDRSLSDLQSSGIDYPAFLEQVKARVAACDDAPPLITTCCDGENGPQFRNTDGKENFWGGFYHELLEDSRQQGSIKPTFIHDYLDSYGACGEVTVSTGGWNTIWHDGKDFAQWSGSDAQKKTIHRLGKVSAEVHLALSEAGQRELGTQEKTVLEEAHRRVLRAETSCNFYWGDSWIARANQDLDDAEATLRRFRAKKYLMDTDPGWNSLEPPLVPDFGCSVSN